MPISSEPLPVWQREHYLCLITLLEQQATKPAPLPVAHKIRSLLPAIHAALDIISQPQSPLLTGVVVSEWLSLRQLEVLYQRAIKSRAPAWVTDSLAIYLIGSENRGHAHDQLLTVLAEYAQDFDILYARLRPLPGDALPLEVIP